MLTTFANGLSQWQEFGLVGVLMGALVAIVWVFVHRSHQREEKLGHRIEELEKWNRSEMAQMIRACMSSLDRNTEVIQAFLEHERRGR